MRDGPRGGVSSLLWLTVRATLQLGLLLENTEGRFVSEFQQLELSSTQTSSPSSTSTSTSSSIALLTTSNKAPFYSSQSNTASSEATVPLLSYFNTGEIKKSVKPSTQDVTMTANFTHTIDANITTELPGKSGHELNVSPGTVFAVVLTSSAVLIVVIFVLYHLRKKWKHLCTCTCTGSACRDCITRSNKGRTRLNSTASDGTLTDDRHDVDTRPRHERELFSIGDEDGGDPRVTDRRRATRLRPTQDDDYFYDEIFERSAFVDERTNKTNSDLTFEDEFDDIDVPDLIFKGSRP